MVRGDHRGGRRTAARRPRPSCPAGELHRIFDSAADHELAIGVLLQLADLQGYLARIEVRIAGERRQGGISYGFQEAAQMPGTQALPALRAAPQWRDIQVALIRLAEGSTRPIWPAISEPMCPGRGRHPVP